MPNPLGNTFPQSQINRNKSPILVTGAHRTGTTWVGKMLAASGEAAYISEPLNVLHRRGVLKVPTKYWYTYICPDNENDYLPAVQEMLTFNYHFRAEFRSLSSREPEVLFRDLLRMGRDSWSFVQGKVRGQRPLVKDPFAVFSIPWFVQRLGFQVVVTVRHPAAFASSLKRLDWPFQFIDLLKQPLLMRDWLEPFRQEIEELLIKVDPSATPDILAQGSLLWRIIYTTVARMQQDIPQIQIVRHEDLSLDPLSGYKNCYQRLGLSFSPKAQKVISESSSSENPTEGSKQNAFDTHLNSRANLNNWKKRLSPAEIQKIRLLTDETAALFYPDFSWD